MKNPRYVIAVPDLKVSTPFYRDVLGFEVHEIEDPGWRFFTRGPVTIMAGAKGAEVISPIADEPWGMREFGIRTADGHRIRFGSER